MTLLLYVSYRQRNRDLERLANLPKIMQFNMEPS